jgi:TolA-binding protein
MEIISITLGYISALLGLVSIYIAIKISARATNIEQKTDDKIIKDAIKETENEDVENLDNSDIQTAVDLLRHNSKHDASYYYLLALKEYKDEHYKTAEQYFIKAIELRKDKYPAALFYLGHTHLKQGNKEKAIECFKKAAKLGHKYAARRLKSMNNN